LDEPYIWTDEDSIEHRITYPADFKPTLHRYRLGEPARKKKPQTIFVGSMCDLFGEWVPDEWIQEIFDACAAAPQHRYLFLTKNPKRYIQLVNNPMIPDSDNFWYGATVTNSEQLHDLWVDGLLGVVDFLSIEPIKEELLPLSLIPLQYAKWVIIGAENGNRKGKIIPQREWIESIVISCRIAGIPVFMKESLRGLMGDGFIQEFPWEG
jgi:protein gp37